ncbi:MAG: MFS transporter [Anaerolineae bacterium]
MNRQRVLRTLTLGTFLMGLAFNIWQTTFNNFAVEELGVTAAQMGIIQSVREIPGFLGFGMGLLAMVVPEISLASLSLVLTGMGLVAMSFSTDATSLLIFTFIFSIGFHGFTPAQASVALVFAERHQAARLLGRLGSVSAVAAVIATAFVFFGVAPLGFRPLLIVAGVAVAIGGLVALYLGKGAQGKGIRQRLIWRKRYWLFYTLTFLMGSRRHIFSTFAIFLLVRSFGVSTQMTAIIFLVTSLLATQTARLQGHLLANRGEKPVLTAYFIAIALVCVGYAYVSWLPLLIVLFIGDSILSGFDIGINSYFHKIAPPTEVTANMSMSQTINHVAALFVPAIGGIIWDRFGSEATFLFGVAVAVACLVATQWMRTAPGVPAIAPSE